MDNIDKINAFMLNDIIKFNIDELVTYIEDNYPSADISNIKRNYFYIQPNGNDLEDMLSQFIIDKITEMGENDNDAENSVRTYIEVFFDITEKSNDTFIVERMEN